MANNLVIAIGRQFGSGGRDIGKGVAEKLGIAFYDKEILANAARESGIMQDLFEEMDERYTPSFLYNLSVGGGYTMPFFYGVDDSHLPTGERLFAWQARTIEKFAKEGPCVIIGRCADYILQENPKLVSIFVYADVDYRKKRIAQRHNVREDVAAVMIRKTDKTRANYYNFSTDRKWGDMTNYDLCVNSAKLGTEKTIQLICDYVTSRQG